METSVGWIVFCQQFLIQEEMPTKYPTIQPSPCLLKWHKPFTGIPDTNKS